MYFSMVADNVLFNSKFNMESFLGGIRGHLKLIPDHKLKDLDVLIRRKCAVVYFPIDFPPESESTQSETLSVVAPVLGDCNIGALCSNHSDILPAKLCRLSPLEETTDSDKRSLCHASSGCNKLEDKSRKCLHIIWPHRWEHDKNPELFFQVLLKLKDEGVLFKLSVLGEEYTDVPGMYHYNIKNNLRLCLRHQTYLFIYLFTDTYKAHSP